MSAITNVTLPTGKLRAHLEGADIPPGFQLPDLKDVLQEASQVTELMRSPAPTETEGRNVKGKSIGILPVSLVYSMMVPKLFKFSYFCEVDDVPHEICFQCIWALEWFIRAIEEGSELQLRTLGHILPHQKEEMARYFLSTNARYKAANHLLKPEVDRPLEALRHLRASMEVDAKRTGPGADIWKENPGLYFMHAAALARSRTDDKKAKELLSRIINDKNIDKGTQGTYFIVKSRIHLSRILRRLGEEPAAQEHEQWLVKWLKKNPHRFSDVTLVELFTTDTDAGDPILAELGGQNWLDNRKHTSRSDYRLTKVCRNCQAREPQVKLSQCSRCKHIFYCSKECQLANFPYHKDGCKEEARYLAKIADMAPDAAQLASDWHTWRVSPVAANTICLMHALGLARDESRSRTHIVLKQVDYVPKSKSQHDRFKVIGAGVFKLDDIWPDLEGLMGLKKGEGKTLVKEVLDEFDHSSGKTGNFLPMLDFMFSPKKAIEGYLGLQGISKGQLRNEAYDANWRSSMNSDREPVGAIKMRRAGVKDAELL